jgi:hypothetical protein
VTPDTDTLLVEFRPWPDATPAEVNDQVGGEDVEEGLVVHYGPDGLPHAFEIEHASERPDLVARALAALRRGRRARAAPRRRPEAAVAARWSDRARRLRPADPHDLHEKDVAISFALR